MADQLEPGSAPDTAGNAAAAAVKDGGAAPAASAKAEGGESAPKPGEAPRKARTTLEIIHEKTAAQKAAASAEEADPGQAGGPQADGKPGEKPDASAKDQKDDDDAVRPDDPERFKRRVDKLATRANEAEKKIAELNAELETVAKELTELRQLRQWAEGLAAVAKHDPVLKRLMLDKEHWLWAGREPSLEDMGGNEAALAAVIKMRAEAAAAEEVAEKTAAERRAKEGTETTDKWMAALDTEADALKADPIYGQFINDADLDRADAFLAKRFEKGDDEFQTYKQVFNVLFAERVAKAHQDTVRREQGERGAQSRRLSQLPPGAPGSAPRPDPRKMSTLDFIKMKTAGLA